jgi:hypothetical protein
MRIEMATASWFSSATYELRCPFGMFEVRCPFFQWNYGHHLWYWKWFEDTEYQLRIPASPHGLKRGWEIMADGLILFTASFDEPKMRRNQMQWTNSSQRVMSYRQRSGRLGIRGANGALLAVLGWDKCNWVGIVRNSISPLESGAFIGMFVSHLNGIGD